MAKSKNQTYIYLARRDKRGMKVLTVFPKGKDNFPATRIKDIKQLNLPHALESQLSKAIHEDRMMWEPFIQCAKSYVDLVSSLRKDGYGRIPMHQTPLHPINLDVLVDKDSKTKTIKAPQPTIGDSAQKIMVRKKS